MEKYQQIHGLDSVPARCRVVGHKRPVRAHAPTIKIQSVQNLKKKKDSESQNTKYEIKKYKI